MRIQIQEFIPALEVWCSAHKRYHPIGVPCTMCVEDVFDGAVVAADPDMSLGAIGDAAAALSKAFVVGSVLRQGPIFWGCTQCGVHRVCSPVIDEESPRTINGAPAAALMMGCPCFICCGGGAFFTEGINPDAYLYAWEN